MLLARVNFISLVSLVVVLFSFDVASAAEWNGGTDWSLFDCPDRRAMWIWSPADTDSSVPNNNRRDWDGSGNVYERFYANYKGVQDLFFDFCENKSIRVLYFFLATWEWNQSDLNAGNLPDETAVAALVSAARDRGMQFWVMFYLWDDPDDARMAEAANKEAIKKVAQATHSFNLKYPDTPIAGIHCDQEPGNNTLYGDLLDTMRIAQNWADANAPELLISQALRPAWRNASLSWNGATKTMNEHMLDTIGHGAYMAYDDRINTIMSWMNPISDYATSIGKEVAAGFEVNYLSWSTVETWNDDILYEPVGTRFRVDAANPVTFEDAMHRVSDDLRIKPGYDRQVIHSYGGYFKHWFGSRPRDYLLGLPGGAYDSASENPAKVSDLRIDGRPLVGVGPTFNEAPTADAGGNRTVPDSDNLPGEDVMLDGSASSDDGRIVSYAWKEDGETIATGASQMVSMLDGSHTISLIVTDNDGYTDTDTAIFTVEAPALAPAAPTGLTVGSGR